MEIEIAAISAGSAVLGALVGGLAGALPSWGAERRGLATERRRELRLSLIRAIDLMGDSISAQRNGDRALRAAHGRDFIRELAVVGTLIERKESVIIAYLTTMMSATFTDDVDDDLKGAFNECSVVIPAWYRGDTTLAEVKADEVEWSARVKKAAAAAAPQPEDSK